MIHRSMQQLSFIPRIDVVETTPVFRGVVDAWVRRARVIRLLTLHEEPRKEQDCAMLAKRDMTFTWK